MFFKTQDSDIFIKYLPKLAIEFGMEESSADDIFQTVAELDSWNRKQSLVKQSRWFSWNESAEIHLGEFWASRMLLEWYYDEEGGIEPESTVSFRQLRDNLGGLKLAFKCLTESTWETSLIYYICSQPCWSWYTDQVKHVKSSADNLDYTIEMAESWGCDNHLLALARLINPNGAQAFSVLFNMSTNDKLPLTIWNLLLELLSQRVGSLSKHCSPPECYAGYFASDPHKVSSAKENMVNDLKYLLKLETSNAEGAQNLAADCRLTCDSTTRLALFLNSKGMRTQCDLVLKSMLLTLPDAKIVEDSHQVVRTAQRSNANERMKTTTVQSLLQNSKVLSSRELKHGAQLDRETFVGEFGRTGKLSYKEVFSCHGHRLPEVFGDIMAPKKWPTLSEPNLVQSAAAWKWLRHYIENRCSASGMKIQDSVGVGVGRAKSVIFKSSIVYSLPSLG